MAVRIRLARYGAKKKPFYRIVAADNRSPRDGRFLEILGTYDPRNKTTGLNLKRDKIEGWLQKGALATETVQKLMKRSSKANAAVPQS